MSDDEGGGGGSGGEKKVRGFAVEKVEIPSYPSGGGGGEKPPELRLYEEGKKWKEARERKLDMKRKEVAAEEMEGVVKKPWVTDLANEMGRDNFNEFLEFQSKWSRDMVFKREQEKKKQEADQRQKEKEEGGLDKWKMSKGSQDIITLSRHASPHSQRGWRKNLAKYLRAKEGDWKHEEKHSFKPNINEKSKGMARGGDVGERLHSHAKKREENIEMKRAKQYGGVNAIPANTTTSPRRTRRTQKETGVVVTDDDYDVGEGKGAGFEMYATRMRVAELAEALEFEMEKNRGYDKLSREVHKEAEYLTAALRKERERNDLLALELSHERSQNAALRAALAARTTSINIGAPLVPPPQPTPISLSLSPRRTEPIRTPSPSPRAGYHGVINLDDL